MIFIKFGLGRESQVCTLIQNFTVLALKMWAYSLKNRFKKRNFSYKFLPKGKFWGSAEKVEYRCTTTNLPVCSDTIIVLKIRPLHSVSVITNFVIPKRDKKNRQADKKTSHFFFNSRHAIHHTWHGDRGGPSRFCTSLTSFDPISNFTARDYWKFEGKCPHHGKMLITWLFVPPKRPN